MLFYKTMEKLCSWIFANVVPLVIQLITLFLTEIIPLYRKHGIFSKIFVIFNCSLATSPVESIHKQHKNNEEKIKKAETPSSSPNVPTLALGSTYFQKSTHEVKAGHTLRHQGLKLTVFSCHRLFHRFFIVVPLA